MSKKFVNYTTEDTISKYFKDVKKTNTLTPDQEVELAVRIKNGDKSAIDELVTANLKFVISVAKEYQGQGLTLSDLINEGNYGLIKAATRFDHTRGFKFISYAVWWIKQSIIQSLNENSRMVRLPANVINKISKLNKEISNGEDNESELLNDMSEFDESLLNYQKTSSLNKITNEDGGEITKIYLSKSCHWKLANSTTMTFAGKVKSLKRDESILRKWTNMGSYPRDFDMFLELRDNGISLMTPIPGYSTHGETAWLSPLTDWSEI